ncbi:hypothetical protein G7Z17_g10039 [Cylindrodendrum hubeiense]|uniref:Uncharacterized protein n=1 Tax=Cylindrodendrum hubeiense TaxID=595255 RepID=A0A9P5GYE2_9HYPO|nr:hypothetical protein G7Z17_g10039 [Cylindrodendrum hubeiense]
MSAFAARIITRAAARRQFSLLGAMRTVGRSMESHPFERISITQKPASPDYAKMVKRVGSQAVVFFPFMAVALGWPAICPLIFDGNL